MSQKITLYHDALLNMNSISDNRRADKKNLGKHRTEKDTDP